MDQTNAVTDADLVAYLDGLCPPEMARRIESDPSLGPRLQALTLPDELQAEFDALLAQAPAMPSMQAANSDTAPLRNVAALAAAFVVGVAISAAIFGARGPNWVDAVASYQALYVAETLAGPAQDAGRTAEVLAQARAATGVDMSAAKVIEGLAFKRAQVLSIDGAFLLQLAYLDDAGRPFALCVTPVATDVADLATKMRFDLAATHWVDGGVGFVLIGGEDIVRVEDMARQVRAAL